MDLYEETKALWTSAKAAEWQARATELTDGISALEAAAAKFREWAPLRFYVNVSKMQSAARPRSRSVSFSLRFRGQDVADVIVSKPDRAVMLSVSADHEKHNLDYFDVGTPQGRCRWDSGKARAFREVFRGVDPKRRGRSPEHGIESRIIEELEATSRARKFGGTLGDVRHCGLGRHEFPLQYSVPISANTGRPLPTGGFIDILVRRGRGRGTHLSVWEVKKDRVTAHALQQAYIYAVTLALMLRGPGGQEWYELFGFHGKLPKKLEIEAVAVVSEDMAPKICDVGKLWADGPLWLPEEATEISLHAAFYHAEPLRMRWEVMQHIGLRAAAD